MQSSDQDSHKDLTSPTHEVSLDYDDDNALDSTIASSFVSTTTMKPTMESENEAVIIHMLETVQGGTSELITEYLPVPPVEEGSSEADNKTIVTTDEDNDLTPSASENLSLDPSDELLETTLNPSPDNDFNINTIPEDEVIFNPVTTANILFTTATTVSLRTEEPTLPVTTDSSITLQPSTEPNDFISDVTDSNEIPEVPKLVNTGMAVENEEDSEVVLIEPEESTSRVDILTVEPVKVTEPEDDTMDSDDQLLGPEEVTVATVDYDTLQPVWVEPEEDAKSSKQDEVEEQNEEVVVAEPENEESKENKEHQTNEEVKDAVEVTDPTRATEVPQLEVEPHLIEPKEVDGRGEADGSEPEKINTEEPDVGMPSEVPKSTEPPIEMIKIEPPRISVIESYPVDYYPPEETHNLPFVPAVSAQPGMDISKPEPEVIEEAPEIPFIVPEDTTVDPEMTVDDVQSAVLTATASLPETITEPDSEKHKELASGESEVSHAGEGLIHKHKTKTYKQNSQ